jgi:hypothetical protein
MDNRNKDKPGNQNMGSQNKGRSGDRGKLHDVDENIGGVGNKGAGSQGTKGNQGNLQTGKPGLRQDQGGMGGTPGRDINR